MSSHFIEFRSTLGRLRDSCRILATQHGQESRVTIIGTKHLLIAWHWHPAKEEHPGWRNR